MTRVMTEDEKQEMEDLFTPTRELLANPTSRLRQIERMHKMVEGGQLALDTANACLEQYGLAPLSNWPRLPPKPKH